MTIKIKTSSPGNRHSTTIDFCLLPSHFFYDSPFVSRVSNGHRRRSNKKSFEKASHWNFGNRDAANWKSQLRNGRKHT
jgi:hypothetical protein